MQRWFYSAMILLWSLICSTALAQTRSIQSYAPQQQLYILLILNHAHRYAETLQVAQSISHLTPAMRLERARAAAQMGQIRQAIADYEQVLGYHPSWTAARLELAAILEGQQQHQTAARHYRYILYDDGPIPDALEDVLQTKVTSLNQDATIQQDKEDYYLHVYVSSLYDANVNKAPNTGSITLHGYRFNLDAPIAAYFITPRIDAGYQYALSPSLGVQTHASLSAALSIWEEQELHGQYDTIQFMGKTGLIWQQSDWSRWMGFIWGDVGWQGSNLASYRYGGWLQWSHQWQTNLSWSITQHLSQEFYPPMDDLSAWHVETVWNGMWDRPQDDSQYQLSLGYTWHQAENRLFAYQSPSAMLSWGKDWGIATIDTSSWVRLYDYQQHSALFGSTRKDIEYGGLMRITPDFLAWYGFKPQLQYLYRNVTSNQEIFTQDIHQINASFVKVF